LNRQKNFTSQNLLSCTNKRAFTFSACQSFLE